MEFPDFHHPNGTIPFPPQSEVLNFLNSYADYFRLNEHIEYNAQVIRVLPIENNKWEVIVKDLLNGEYITEIYDAVFVCNGHFFAPSIPKFENVTEFKGKMIHSHDYRSPERFQGIHAHLNIICLILQISLEFNLNEKKDIPKLIYCELNEIFFYEFKR